MISKFNRQEMRQLAEAAAAQKRDLLDHGGYMTIPNDHWRKIVPGMVQKYGSDARDAAAIWMYLHSYVQGDPQNDFWMWAYPSRDQICGDLAIGVNRFRKLVKILEDAGLIVTTMIQRERKAPKLFFLPFYR